MADYRIFQGKTTTQVDSHTGRSAEAEGWYYEPSDHTGNVLYSDSYPTQEAAREAADAEFGEYE